jgi:signal transduction histidine kinase
LLNFTMANFANLVWAILGFGLSGGVGWWLGRRSQPSVQPSVQPLAQKPADSPAPLPSQPSPQPLPSHSDSDLAEQLRQTQLAYQMAQYISQFKAGFLARTSHELRSPLNGMLGVHQLILSDLCESPEEEREFIEQAHTSTLKMVKILDEIIEVSKVEHGSQSMVLEPVDLTEVLDEVYLFTYLQAQNRNLQLQINPPDSDLYVLADPRRLKQALLILVDTPILLMQEGYIRVSVHPDPEQVYAHIRIEDNRPIDTWQEPLDLLQATQKNNAIEITPATVQEMVSKPMERSPGMSLLMVQTLVELMNGRLELLSTPSSPQGSGEATEHQTCVRCSIPLVPPEPEELD